MEKFNDVLKSLIGLLLLFSFIIAFSSCEQTQQQDSKDKDSVSERDTSSAAQEKDTLSWKTRMEEERKQMDARFDSLRVKAKSKGKKAEQETNRLIDSLNEERKDFMNSDTGEKMEEKWEKFKEKSKTALDSLDKKL